VVDGKRFVACRIVNSYSAMCVVGIFFPVSAFLRALEALSEEGL
jgi:hypothetical protein